MNKKVIIAAMTLILAVSITGCAKKTDSNTASPDGAPIDASEAYENNVVYSKQVNMKKVDGEEGTSDSKKEEFSGELSTAKISIEDAKIIEYEGENIAVVSFKYKNTLSVPQPFSSAVMLNAYQNDTPIRAAVVTGVEGVSMLSQAEFVEAGDTITVQATFRLEDKSPLTVEVIDFAGGETKTDPLTKVFSF